MRLRARPRPNLFALALAALGFLLLPALLAFASAGEPPSTRRSKAAYAAQAQPLSEALSVDGLELGRPVFLQITKSPAELTAFVKANDGTFKAFRTWPVCSVSGTLGPKVREGDGQAPEGFYRVKPDQMNPASSYHLSFNLGYPNAFDRANGRTGSYLMVHGACVSIGCFAMTDDGIEEIWTLMQAAFAAGQPAIDVHIFPFAMTPENIAAQAESSHAAFWASLAPAWDAFSRTGKVPQVTVSDRTYRVRAVQ